jgi:preprotein translocase SecE subunit
MASPDTKSQKKEEAEMAADTTAATAITPSGGDERRGAGGGERPPERAAAPKPGFFAIYKKGQGYWTRMGTAIGAAGLCGLITWQLYRYIPAFMSSTDPARARQVALIAAGTFAAVFIFLAWRLMNKPANVDFLIATDGEMKKVNWTSRRELIGSTKVVIFFMFAIAIILFVLDLLFNTVFFYVDVLKIPWWKQVFGGGQ